MYRESTSYDPLKVKDFPKEAKLADPRPLIYVCDLHNFVAKLAEYLDKNSLMKYIEVYVLKVKPACPMVVGTLIDQDCSVPIHGAAHEPTGLRVPREPHPREF